MKYQVKFGMARTYDTPELHENTRSKIFNDKSKAEECLDRLNKFNFKDAYTSEFLLVAWTDLREINEDD
jgi:hypothetical protein